MTENNTTEPELYEGFACIHDDGLAEVEAMREYVKARFREGTENFTGQEPDDHFLTAVLYSLNFDFGAWVTSVGVDMWFGVSAINYEGTFQTYIQADLFEDAILATWKAFDDRSKSVNVDE